MAFGKSLGQYSRYSGTGYELLGASGGDDMPGAPPLDDWLGTSAGAAATAGELGVRESTQRHASDHKTADTPNANMPTTERSK